MICRPVARASATIGSVGRQTAAVARRNSPVRDRARRSPWARHRRRAPASGSSAAAPGPGGGEGSRDRPVRPCAIRGGRPCRCRRDRFRAAWCRSNLRRAALRRGRRGSGGTAGRRGRAPRCAGGSSEMPRCRSWSISSRISRGSTTTPAPTMERQSGFRMPDGMRWSLKCLDRSARCDRRWRPPLARTTMSAAAASVSVSFPLPSSPHWPPMTIVAGIVLSLLSCWPAATRRRAAWAQPSNCSRKSSISRCSAITCCAQMQDRRRAGEVDPKVVDQPTDRCTCSMSASE